MNRKYAFQVNPKHFGGIRALLLGIWNLYRNKVKRIKIVYFLIDWVGYKYYKKILMLGIVPKV